MVNTEALLVAFYNSDVVLAGEALEAFMDVPSTRPKQFITVERTGGGLDTFRDLPMVAVQVWAKSRYEASRLAAVVAERTKLAAFLPTVARVNVNSLYNFPDPDSKQARYQVVVELVTKHD